MTYFSKTYFTESSRTSLHALNRRFSVFHCTNINVKKYGLWNVSLLNTFKVFMPRWIFLKMRLSILCISISHIYMHIFYWVHPVNTTAHSLRLFTLNRQIFLTINHCYGVKLSASNTATWIHQHTFVC